MNHIVKLIDTLALCIPQLDSKPLLADAPASADQGEILGWLADHLEQQGLLVYEEWKEYFGELPALRPLSGIDFSAYDSTFVVGLVEHIDWEEVDPELTYTLPYEMPYLEYINGFLRDHGLRLVDLLPFENAYILCVKDDETLLEQLCQCLKPFDMDIDVREAMDAQQAKEHVEKLLIS